MGGNSETICIQLFRIDKNRYIVTYCACHFRADVPAIIPPCSGDENLFIFFFFKKKAKKIYVTHVISTLLFERQQCVHFETAPALLSGKQLQRSHFCGFSFGR